jgi:ribonuclease BN (tRNA processing enzyme)
MSFQVLGGRCYDIDPFLLLQVDQHYYVINAPDNSARLALDRHLKPPNLRQIFLTGPHAEASAGLYSFLFFCRDCTSTAGITGPPSITRIYTHSAFYAQFNFPQTTQSYSDKHITVTTIPLHTSVLLSFSFSGRLGKFLPAKATALGIKPGPDFKKLATGGSITLPDGRTVTSAEVTESPIPSEKVLIIDCATLPDIDALPADLSDYSWFIHLTRPELLNLPEYLSHFPISVPNVCFMRSGYRAFGDRALAHIKLLSAEPAVSSCGFYESPPPGFTNVNTGDSIVLHPAAKRGVHIEPQSPAPDLICGLPTFESFAVTFLGTSARLPTLWRSNPGYLIHTADGFVILDPGDGFTGQLFRKYGHVQANVILENTICVWISHHHVDHYYGVQRLLSGRASVTESDLIVSCPPDVANEFRYIAGGCDRERVRAVFAESVAGDVISIGRVRIRNVEVYHTEGSMGCFI